MVHKHNWIRVESYIVASDLELKNKYELVIWDCHCGARKRVKVKGKSGLTTVWKSTWDERNNYHCKICQRYGSLCVCCSEAGWTRIM